MGRFIFSFAHNILEILENKNNNHYTNGEFWLINQVKKYNPKIVFDVGANKGDWTIFLKKSIPDAYIYSFEPITSTFRELENNTKVISGVCCNQLALSDRTGKLEMNYFKDNSLFSSIYKHPSLSDDYELEIVEMMTGDEFCITKNIEFIDFLKIDVEGSEFKVLQGFSFFLKEKRIRLIQFEYGQFSLESKVLLKDYYEFFENLGYVVGKIFPTYIDFSPYSVKKENFLTANFIALAFGDSLTKSFKGK
ncbi:FkbM family methyltransferase [Mongoliitalea lutea]|uniref:Nodulation protein noeI- methyltransferase n=2 Tax=Mongoliitalea lutea TaxID=849756 RepID=A0A8J3G3V9_9BACT|nr:FkbM family methyltransferase [Mongoliitalea lutea]GHB23868.1 nodulation protein noeI- methyltransferase [Mongoliitalea lutea]